MTARREHKGAAPATTLAGNISSSDTTILLTSGSNWPTGAVGNFFIVIDRGNAGEEKVLCSARSTNTLTVTTRGVDDTAASAHTAGVAVEHCLTAIELDQANQHQADTSVDDHTQYMLASGTRHDLTARHTFGAALGTPAAATTSAVGDAAAAGSAAGPARADHTHGREAFATNAVVLGTAAAAGAATTLIRSDATIAAFDATVPTSSAVGDAAAAGSVAKAARRDHTHGREAFAAPTTLATTSTQTTGTATTINHSDHDHGYPAAAPRGTVGYAQVVANQAGIGAGPTDLTSLTVTFTTVAGRRYKITGHVQGLVNTSDSAWAIDVLEGGTTLGRVGVVDVPFTHRGMAAGSIVITPSAAAHTYKLTATRYAGAGTLDIEASATQPAYIHMEDAGT